MLPASLVHFVCLDLRLQGLASPSLAVLYMELASATGLQKTKAGVSGTTVSDYQNQPADCKQSNPPNFMPYSRHANDKTVFPILIMPF